MTEAARDYSALEAKHGIGVYSQRGIALVRGLGAKVWDDQGRCYIDAAAAHGVAGLGHCHPAVVEAIQKQAAQLISCSTIFANDQRAMLMQELGDALPEGLDRLFFCNSGAEAVEAAIKFARYSTGKTGLIAAMRGFHGRTFGALSATFEPHYRTPFLPLLSDVQHVPYNNLEALEAAFNEQTGAVILEAVQGEGGVRPGTVEFLQGAQRLCHARGALLIVDEIQTGFGRTGKLFACEHSGMAPDLLCMAKALAGGFPMGAVALGSRVKQLEIGLHGTTFGANPLACAAARASLKVMLTENLPGQAEEKGQYLFEKLRALSSRKIREVRGVGLMAGIELRERVAPYLGALQERGVLALNAGPTVLRLLPPLVISREEIDQVVEAVAVVLG